jgi:CHASE2 domain-containing sensor protein
MKRFKIASNRRLRTLLLLLVALVGTGIWLAAYSTHVLRSLELSTVNTRFSIRGAEKAPNNIVVVRIDAATFQDLNKQWPFPRAVDGRVLSRISAQHPAAVAFDVQLSEPSALGQNDDVALLNDIQSSGGKAIFADNEPTTRGDVSFLGSGEGKKLLGEVGARARSPLTPAA